MSNDSRPVRHPRPAPSRPKPQPAAAVPVSSPPPPVGSPSPASPSPAAPDHQPEAIEPAAAIRADPAPAVRNEVARPRRADRRRAANDAGRRQVLRTSLQAVAALLAAFVVVAVVLALANGGSGTEHRASPTATARGANLAAPGLASAFLAAAGSDVAAVTTYDYRHLDDALYAGLAVTTGPYREAFRAAMTGDLARTARAQHVVHSFEQLDAGIGVINAAGTQAKVLVFGRERIKDDRTGPATQVQPITLCATIRRDGNRYRIGDLVEGADPGLPPGGPELPVAAEAARAEVGNLLNYRRTTFDADLRRALGAATGPLREQISHGAAGTERAMRKGKYDTTGTVTALAVMRADAETVTLLVAAEAGRLVDGATASPGTTQRRYEVTVTHTPSGWAASGIRSVDGGS